MDTVVIMQARHDGHLKKAPVYGDGQKGLETVYTLKVEQRGFIVGFWVGEKGVKGDPKIGLNKWKDGVTIN